MKASVLVKSEIEIILPEVNPKTTLSLISLLIKSSNELPYIPTTTVYALGSGVL